MIKGQFDSTCSFYANIIQTQIRDEVQIYPLNNSKTSKTIVSPSLISRYELADEDKISCICWCNNLLSKNENKKRNKRRQSGSETTNSSNFYLIVGLASGSFLVLSPFRKGLVNKIEASRPLAGLTSNWDGSSFFALSEDNYISEYSVIENKEISSIKVAVSDEISHFKSIVIKGELSLILASSSLYLMDPSEPSKIQELLKHDELITSIEPSNLNKDLIYFTGEESNLIHNFSFEDKSVGAPLRTAFSPSHLQVLKLQPDEFLACFSEASIELFSTSDASLEDDNTLIFTNSKEFPFVDAAYVGSKLVGVWFNGFEPVFEHINWFKDTKGDVQVNISLPEEESSEEEDDDEDLEDEEEEEKPLRVRAEKLAEKLNQHLASTFGRQKQILEICSKIDNEDIIRATIQHIGSTESNKLFEIISKRVGEKPSRAVGLNLWLKWLLIAHGGIISKNSSNYRSLKTLHNSFTKSSKILPSLLSLQGRLSLLQSQLKLRDEISSVGEQDEQVEEAEDNETELVIVNGENDDYGYEDDDEEVEEEGEDEN